MVVWCEGVGSLLVSFLFCFGFFLALISVQIFYSGLYTSVPSSIQVNALIKCKGYGSRRNREGEREGFMYVILTYFITALNSSII